MEPKEHTLQLRQYWNQELQNDSAYC